MNRQSYNVNSGLISRREIGRRQMLQSLGATAAMAFLSDAASVVTAAAQNAAGNGRAFPAPTNINHLSCAGPDYARMRDFYVDLFGMRVSWDNGKQCALEFGDPAAPNGMY